MKTINSGIIIDSPKWIPHQNTYSCHAVYYLDEESGGYTVVARNLAGVVSEGDSMDSATANIIDAFRGAIESYLECKMPIPWGDCIALHGTDYEQEKHLLVTIDA